MTVDVRLKPYLRPGLDVLFVGLNPPRQSNANGHYYSGSASRFFKLLYLSGLITRAIPRAEADETVFGTEAINYRNCAYGVVDLVDNLVETNGSLVRHTPSHVSTLVERILAVKPRFVCVIQSKVRDALNESGRFLRSLHYGYCGQILPGSAAHFVLNYFPNGNSIGDGPKLQIFAELRNRL